MLCRRESTHVNTPKLINLLCGKVQRSLVLGTPSVAHHAMNSTRLVHNLVDRFLKSLFFGDVDFQRK
jgi:hypothetical protein